MAGLDLGFVIGVMGCTCAVIVQARARHGPARLSHCLEAVAALNVAGAKAVIARDLAGLGEAMRIAEHMRMM